MAKQGSKFITLIVVSDERSPVKRFQVPHAFVQRGVAGAVVLALVLAGAVWDYWRVRADNAELAGLRIQTAEQSEHLQLVETTLDTVRGELDRVREFERKVRIIANLPGAAGVGGEEITELVPAGAGDRVLPPAGVPVDLMTPGEVEGKGAGPVSQFEGPEGLGLDPELALADGLTSSGAQRLYRLDATARGLGEGMEARADSLDLLLGELEVKRTRLASMPSIWPTRGWLTSRYGYRVSPFTGKRHLHSGIDIASDHGTPIIAPARGKVVFAGRKGPLGNAITVDHGFGVRTTYGHAADLYVERGDQVVRGQQLAAVGSTGRSTGPHLHYVVEIKGKTKDPLNYIFD